MKALLQKMLGPIKSTLRPLVYRLLERLFQHSKVKALIIAHCVDTFTAHCINTFTAYCLEGVRRTIHDDVRDHVRDHVLDHVRRYLDDRIGVRVELEIAKVVVDLGARLDQTLLVIEGIKVRDLFEEAQKHLDAIRAETHFLAADASRSRALLRLLAADHPAYQPLVERTARMFDDQWRQLAEGARNDGLALTAACDEVIQLTGLDRSWFAGRRVLDAGCGAGHFSRALARLGADVMAIDLSECAIANLRREAVASGLKIQAFRHDLLQAANLEPRSFGLIWCYDVLHHTGNAYRAFQNLCPLIAEDGYLLLMLHGEPRLDVVEDFLELNRYERSRRLTREDIEGPLAVINGSGAPGAPDEPPWAAPPIQDLYTFDEVRDWLVQAGFTAVRRAREDRNLFVIARKGMPPRLLGN
jgi:2-polyprenyl-3-methyl-5-hydroxy-6-metoxy-1,4-benzoquinol methylase